MFSLAGRSALVSLSITPRLLTPPAQPRDVEQLLDLIQAFAKPL